MMSLVKLQDLTGRVALVTGGSIKNLFISDGSQFTSGAACNPTVTIVSLAIRQADHIAGAMQRKEI
jgi:choline dehydrogenase-like flavoprotein